MNYSFGALGNAALGTAYGIQQVTGTAQSYGYYDLQVQYNQMMQQALSLYNGHPTVPARSPKKETTDASDNEAWLDRRVNEIRVAL